MSYTPTEWKAGDKITSTKLNKLENGVANSGALIVHDDESTGALDKTWAEINAAAPLVYLDTGDAYAYLGSSPVRHGDSYYCNFRLGVNYIEFATTTEDGYPVFIDNKNY